MTALPACSRNSAGDRKAVAGTDLIARGLDHSAGALTYWLRVQQGRDAEAEQILRAGLTATGEIADD